MAKLLYVEASPRKSRSASIEVARAFLEEYAATHPDDEVSTLDVWNLDLPEFDGDMIDAKYAIFRGAEHTPAQAEAWSEVKALFDRFNDADKYLFSLPMWNFGIPYKLKHFFDVITQPGLAFNYTPAEGYTGLVTGRPAIVIYARGGEYRIGTGVENFDMQKQYLELLLGFMGFLGHPPNLRGTDVRRSGPGRRGQGSCEGLRAGARRTVLNDRLILRNA